MASIMNDSVREISLLVKSLVSSSLSPIISSPSSDISVSGSYSSELWCMYLAVSTKRWRAKAKKLSKYPSLVLSYHGLDGSLSISLSITSNIYGRIFLGIWKQTRTRQKMVCSRCDYRHHGGDCELPPQCVSPGYRRHPLHRCLSPLRGQ